MKSVLPQDRPAIGEVMRTARQNLGVSQLDLALRLGISQRHVSFVETGRSRPSRDLILNWMAEMRAPDSIRNVALHRAGFALASAAPAPANDETPQTPPVLTRVLDAHEPLPGMVFGPDWRMLSLNPGGQWLFRLVMPEFLAAIPDIRGGWDMIAGLGHEGGLLSHMREPAAVAGSLLNQLRIEQWTWPELRPRIDRLESALRQRFGATPRHLRRDVHEPGLNLVFDTPLGALSFFTVQSMFTLPQDVTPGSLRTGLWYAADEATRGIMRDRPEPPAGSAVSPPSQKGVA